MKTTGIHTMPFIILFSIRDLTNSPFYLYGGEDDCMQDVFFLENMADLFHRYAGNKYDHGKWYIR